MSYRSDIIDIFDEIDSDLQDIYNDLDAIEGINQIDNIKEMVSVLLKKFC